MAKKLSETELGGLTLETTKTEDELELLVEQLPSVPETEPLRVRGVLAAQQGARPKVKSKNTCNKKGSKAARYVHEADRYHKSSDVSDIDTQTSGSISRSSAKSKKNSAHVKQAKHGHKKSKKCTYQLSSDDNSGFDSSSDTESTGSDSGEEKRGNPKKLPKNLRFDGTTAWNSFKQKFSSFRDVYGWSDSECRDYLNWSLEGKALDFFTYTTMSKYMSYKQIMRKLEKRFGVRDIIEVSRVRFQQASQHPDESLEDWADRVLTLATPAFRNFDDDGRYCRQEAIAKFCQGCSDKQAGKHACLKRPKTMHRALCLVKHYKYVTEAVNLNSDKLSYHSANAIGPMSEARFGEILESAVNKFAATLLTSSDTTAVGDADATSQSD